MDRISCLPNEIICHIVSFLSAKEAVFTSVLSKRFLNLYSIIPNLKFNEWAQNQGSLTDFLDGVLALPVSSRIRKFSLKCYERIEPAQYAHVNRCLCAVLKHGVLDIELEMNGGRLYSLPFEVFTCKTVVKLMLGCDFDGCFIVDVLPDNASLPALETLVLHSVRFKKFRGCAFEKLLSACPVLKELIMDGMEWKFWKWSGNISSPTLQRLTIHCGETNETSSRITLDTPSLTYFKCSDYVPDEYPVFYLDSLVEAELDLMLTSNIIFNNGRDFDKDIISNPTNLIKGLRNVQIMNLTHSDTFEAFSYFHDAIPVFENLYHLTITPEENVGSCWTFLQFLLKKTPNLETFIINGPLHYHERQPKYVCDCLSGYSFLESCPLEVLQVTDYRGTTAEVEQLKHFLGKLPCLELVKLHTRARSGRKEEKLKLPRASSKCKIKVTFS